MQELNFGTSYDAMKRILLILALVFTASHANAQKLSLEAVSSYLNGMRNAKAKFVQANPDKTLAQGVLYIKKPGRIRYEYTVPSDSLVIADGTFLSIFDKKSNRGAQLYDLKKTPLDILLAGNVNLSATGAVKSVKSDGVKTEIVAVDPQNPRNGNITMVFTANPIELRQWVVKDQLGRKTTVILNDLQVLGSVSDELFDIRRADAALRR